MDRKTQTIFKYLDLTYGDCEIYHSEKNIGINGLCVYYKDLKKVGFVSLVYEDLCCWFGDGNYHTILSQWVITKYDLEII